MRTTKRACVAILAAFGAASCASDAPVMPTVDHVDLARFMGDWYVIASIPTFLEKGAHNAIESYSLNEDGTIATTFTFRDGAYDGKLKEYTPKGFVLDKETNARWGMRFIWPIKADYRVAWLDEDYSQTIIARQKRDYVWIMAREPQIPEADYDTLLGIVASLGYDMSKVLEVPQRW